MDRRQRKSREAILNAFISLLADRDFGQITVGEIIEKADVGRATFYSHFETKDFLLRALCEDLFCHIQDVSFGTTEHRHVFACDTKDSVFLHLFRHLMQNDNHILELLSCPSRDLFLRYFRAGLRKMVYENLPLFAERKSEKLPENFWMDHIMATLVETVCWWIENGMKESPETITEYFYLAV